MLELPERLSFSEILHVLMDQITENNLISRKLVQGLDTLRIALGKKLNISEKKLFEKEQQVYLFLICLTGKNSRDEESLRQGMGKVGSFLSSMSKTCIGETLPDGTGMFLAPFPMEKHLQMPCMISAFSLPFFRKMKRSTFM